MIRGNRILNSLLPSANIFKKQPLGSFVTTYDNVTISKVMWFDKKVVTMLSTFRGSHPIHKVERFDRKK